MFIAKHSISFKKELNNLMQSGPFNTIIQNSIGVGGFDTVVPGEKFVDVESGILI